MNRNRIQGLRPYNRKRRRLMKSAGVLAAGAFFHPLRVVSDALSGSDVKEVTRTSFVMGSIVAVTLYTEDRRHGEEAIDAALREMRALESLMSVFERGSQISILNRTGYDRETAVDSRVLEMLETAAKVHEMTEGAFDPTVEPLMTVFGFRDEVSVGKLYPGDREIRAALEAVGMRHVVLSREAGTVVIAHQGTAIDPGGIGVGFAIDRAIRILRFHGIESALINHSGDFYALGSPPSGAAWEIGIRDPVDPAGLLASVRLRNAALCTSANYENNIILGNQPVGHILDPVSGKNPDEFTSVTVVAASAAEADALSTGVFVRGIGHLEAMKKKAPDLRILVAFAEEPPGKCLWIGE